MKYADRFIRFFVPGIPGTAGSKRGFVNKATGRVQIVDTCKRGPAWRADVVTAVSRAVAGDPFLGPVGLQVYFVLRRPKAHYRTGKHAHILRDDADTWHTSKPDLTKLVRAIEDACKGIAWRDDSQVIAQHTFKLYGSRPGAWALIYEPDYVPVIPDWVDWSDDR